MSFYVDLSPSTHSTERPVYWRNLHSGILGTSDPVPRTCFNCSSQTHESRQCPYPRDSAAFVENRDTFNMERASMPSGLQSDSGVRVHDFEASRTRALGFLDQFQPGHVSQRLKAALGCGPAAEDGWPWLYNMLDWGYPPGWAPFELQAHPEQTVRERWTGTRLGVDALQQARDQEVEGLTQPSAPLPASEAPPIPPPPPPPEHHGRKERKRVKLVDYRTCLFSSSHLPVCFPGRLPTVLKHNARDDDDASDMSISSE